MIDDVPTWVGQLELDGDGRLRAVTPAPSDEYPRARILVRSEGRPVGFLDVAVPPTGLAPGVLAELAGEQFADRIVRPPAAGALPESAPPISVVVCTRDRPARLARCVRSLQALDYDDYEVVVVDDASTGDTTRRYVEQVAATDGRVRYVHEEVIGLSAARNRGLAESRHAHVAFTDDDVLVDEGWLRAVAIGFRRDPRVACVTGLVVSGTLDDATERWFEAGASWAHRLDPVVFDAGERRSPEFPFRMGPFGANFAVDRAVATSIGGFDEALGAGTAVGAGEEVDFFVRLMRSGLAVAYEPSAIVWHFPRTAFADLRRQVRSYGRSAAVLAVMQARSPSTWAALARQAPRQLLHVVRHATRTASAGPVGPSLERARIWGWVTGPGAYRRGRRVADRRRRHVA